MRAANLEQVQSERDELIGRSEPVPARELSLNAESKSGGSGEFNFLRKSRKKRPLTHFPARCSWQSRSIDRFSPFHNIDAERNRLASNASGL
ncbi:hypothetical protein AVEN_87555-1 [Araneus ventricosus]|uniref:Uncharacterized protein n=1 Tax=Araneus ventricosus TaxID=182803 RepID=A0A4Y2RCW8_ARAVE|nr:hypothetical protein AVEN_246662-1 [Araneus ventricosus]GBN73614.1 hypothetical protein AVEN_87555-1 [Araneus ventricosus]